MELMDAVDSWIPDPQRDTDKDFIMPVEDVFTITGRGTVATGRVEAGVLHLNEEVEIAGLKEETKKTVVTGIEMFRKLLDELRLVITSVLCFVVFREQRSKEDRFWLNQVPFTAIPNLPLRYTF